MAKKNGNNRMGVGALADRIKAVANPKGDQKFHLFLGAGASATSGVKLASTMMEDFVSTLRSEDRHDAFENEDWYLNDDRKFERLFDLAHPTAQLRQNYINSCISGASPSSGYYYLASLMHGRASFEKVMTTNFDDLVMMACMNLSSVRRPLELWDPSLFAKIEPYGQYPLVIKLHGDYRNPGMKTSIDAVDQTFENFKTPFVQLSRRSGLVVLGYSGADKVLTDMIESNIRSSDFFSLGIYWCLRKGEKPNQTVQSLAEKGRGRFNFVEIDDFDSTMREVFVRCTREYPEIEMPRLTSRGLTDWLGTQLVLELGDPDSHAPIEQGMSYLRIAAPIDLTLVARAAQRMADLNRASEADAFRKTVIDSRAHFIGDPMITFDIALAFLWLERQDDADAILEIGKEAHTRNGKHSLWNEDRYQINKCLVTRARGQSLSPEQKTTLQTIAEGNKLPEQMGANILLDEWKKAATTLDYLFKSDAIKSQPDQVRKWYILKYFHKHGRSYLSPESSEILTKAFTPPAKPGAIIGSNPANLADALNAQDAAAKKQA
ncbi:MAG: SIR2 family protein [Planctomycetes bacterium]|nr:SIR2 family protein [Planctomycetota bacterium]